MRFGVLALQGAFAAHQNMLASIGVDTIQVRTPAQLDEVDALVMPGGESTAMCRLIAISHLQAPLADRLANGMAAFGTCAGMILLASDVRDGRPDQFWFSAIDISVRRNGYGRQLESFEGFIDLPNDDVPMPAIFIRAPVVESVGAGVEVLSTVDDVPVLCQQGTVMVASFHPEISQDARIHRRFVESTGS
jgi:pyridoxal 5'-phosphate synthase pdxT subunit